MNDEPCVVEINGRDYFVSCSGVDSLIVYDGSLINTSGSSLTLYTDYPAYNDTQGGYPRITAPSNQRAYIRNTYNGTQTQLNVMAFKVKNRHVTNDFLLSIVLIGVVVISLFKRG